MTAVWGALSAMKGKSDTMSFIDGSTRTLELPTLEQCRNSTLMLEPYLPNDEIEYDRENLALGRAEDGSLLARWSSTTVLFIFGPNAADYSAVWIRFPPAAPPQQPAVLTP